MDETTLKAMADIEEKREADAYKTFTDRVSQIMLKIDQLTKDLKYMKKTLLETKFEYKKLEID